MAAFVFERRSRHLFPVTKSNCGEFFDITFRGMQVTYVEPTAFNTISELNAVVPGAIMATTAPALWKTHKLVTNHDKIKAYLTSPRLHKVSFAMRAARRVRGRGQSVFVS
ncbi:hypothetical protein GGF32_000421 [Allomyces javanicus]|nr:hypothetical protein GGF32_000421 [Allomyces javanicus]